MQHRSVDTLREHLSEAMVRTLVEHSPDVFARFDRSLRYLYLSPSCAKYLAKAPHEVVGKLRADVGFTSEVADRHEAIMRAVLSDGQPRSADLVLGEHVFECNYYPDAAAGGQISGVIAISRDVTARRRAERTSTRLLEQQAAFLEALPDPAWIKDENGVFLAANDAVARDCGRSVQEIVGRTNAELWPPEIAERFDAVDEQVRRARTRCTFSEQRLTWEGITRHYEVVVAPLPSESGAYAGCIGIARDITKRVIALRALERSERLFRALTESTSELVVISGADGTLRYANPRMLRLLGCDWPVCAKLKLTDIVHPDDRKSVRDRVAKIIVDSGHAEIDHFRVRDANGDWHAVEATVESLLRDPAVSGVVLTMRDVTRRIEMEKTLQDRQRQLEQAQKMEAVGRLAGGVAHDFNNLLTVITTCADFLQTSFHDGDPARDDVEEIRAAARRAADLTRQLLAFSRKQILDPHVLDLGDAAKAIESMLRRIIGEDVDLAVEPSPGLWRVKVDPGQLEQVIVNLAVNARDAMPTGGALRMRVENVQVTCPSEAGGAPPGEYVALSVADTGCGIDSATLARIFEPFFTTKEAGKGTGLGLSTVYGIVKQSGGYISVESEPGRGSTFRVYLPRWSGASEGERPRRDSTVPVAHANATILLVEDDANVRAVAQRILKRAGYTVVATSNGDEALEVTTRRGGDIALVVTDFVMPRMSGRDLVERIKESGHAPAVLYMSGYADDELIRNGFLPEGTAFLPKPFTAASLKKRVAEALHARPRPSAGS